MMLTKKVPIYPSHEQETVLLAFSEKCRLIYNFVLAERRGWWERNKDLPRDDREPCITYNKQQDDLPGIKKQYASSRSVNSVERRSSSVG